jgi:hypothetical protein
MIFDESASLRFTSEHSYFADVQGTSRFMLALVAKFVINKVCLKNRIGRYFSLSGSAG